VRHAAQTASMRMGYGAAALGLACTLLAGCGSDGGTPETSGSSATTPPAELPTTLPSHDGLVGAIDSARRLALCENVRLYATAVEGGLSTSADEAFNATIQTLKQTPKVDALLVLAAKWELIRTRKGDSATAQRLLDFCGSVQH